MLPVKAGAQGQSCIRAFCYCLLLSVNVLIPEKTLCFLQHASGIVIFAPIETVTEKRQREAVVFLLDLGSGYILVCFTLNTKD